MKHLYQVEVPNHEEDRSDIYQLFADSENDAIELVKAGKAEHMDWHLTFCAKDTIAHRIDLGINHLEELK